MYFLYNIYYYNTMSQQWFDSIYIEFIYILTPKNCSFTKLDFVLLLALKLCYNSVFFLHFII